MLQCFLISHEKGGMEDRVNLPLRGNTKVEGCAGDDFLDFKGAGSFHLKFLGSVHVEVGGLKPDLTVTSKTVTMFGIFVVYIMQYLYVWEYRLALVRACDV